MSSRVLSKHPPKRSRAAWYADVKPLHDEGMSGLAIARRLGISNSFVYGLLNDPTGERDRERKLGYAGTCVDCGGPTDGSNGFGPNASERCFECRNDYQRVVLKYWTRDRIVAAIRRFAREYGRPPKADDWNHAGRGDGWPPATSCYKAGERSSSPFDTWADAIEAAGFPRPRVGGHERTGTVQLREAGHYALRRARERGELGITTTLLAQERGTIRESARKNLNGLERRGLIYREGTEGLAIVYKAVGS